MGDPVVRSQAEAAQGPAAVPGRVLWRCRRGMKELDVVLQRYLQRHWSGASTTQRAVFERLLEMPDPILAACLLRHEPAPHAELEGLLALLREDQDAAARRDLSSPSPA